MGITRANNPELEVFDAIVEANQYLGMDKHESQLEASRMLDKLKLWWGKSAPATWVVKDQGKQLPLIKEETI